MIHLALVSKKKIAVNNQPYMACVDARVKKSMETASFRKKSTCQLCCIPCLHKKKNNKIEDAIREARAYI